MKKFLSLVLALVMTMSLVTISAGAKDFTDAEEVTYTEAVDVLSAVKVIDGYTDGAFKPNNQLNRGQAAKILCNMILGPTTASALKADAAPFKDVPADSTFAAYIAYCAKAGIIDGYTDGTFRPAAPLTGYAFMKLLLGALGYDKDVEGYNQPNWSINVAKRALSIGLDDGLVEDFDGTKIVTREEACLYALNTLKADMVEYDAKTNISVGGAEVVIAGSKAQAVTTTAESNTIKDEKSATNNVYTVQFGEKYFKDLTLKSDTDDFGRPANTWKVKKTTVGTYAKTADATYSKKVTQGDLYTLVGKDVYDDLKDGNEPKAKLTVYVNGAKTVQTKTESAILPYIQKNSSDAAGKGAVEADNGRLTEVYINSDNAVTIVMIDTWIFQAAEDYNSKQENMKIVAAGDTTISLTSNTLSADDFAAIKDFKEDDYLLVTAVVSGAKYEVKSVEKAETVTGTINSYKDESSVTMDGTEYDYSANTSKAAGGVKKTPYTVGQAAILVVDKYGYVIAVDEALVSSNYVFIAGIDVTGSLVAGKAHADAYYTDGTAEEIVVDKIINGSTTIKNAGEINDGTHDYQWYTYSKTADGRIILLNIESKYSPVKALYKGVGDGSTANPVMHNNTVAFMETDDTTPTAVTPAPANDSTIVLVRDRNNEVSVYTGLKAIPDVTLTKTAATTDKIDAYTLKNTKTTYTSMAFLDVTADADTDISIIGGDENAALVYVVKYDGQYYVNENNTYYTYKLLNDEGKTDTVKADSPVAGTGSSIHTVYYKARTNSDEEITSLPIVPNTGKYFNSKDTTNGGSAMTGKVTFADGVLTLGDKGSYTVASDAKIVLVTMKGTGLNKDPDASYEATTGLTAKGLANALKGYNVTANIAGACSDTTRTKITELYVTVTSALATTDAVTPAATISGTTTYSVGAPASPLTVSVSNSGVCGTLTYQWYKDGVKEVGSTGTTYTPSTASIGSTVYTCVVTNTDASMSVNTVATKSVSETVTVEAAPAAEYGVRISAGTTLKVFTIDGSAAGTIDDADAVLNIIDWLENVKNRPVSSFSVSGSTYSFATTAEVAGQTIAADTYTWNASADKEQGITYSVNGGASTIGYVGESITLTGGKYYTADEGATFAPVGSVSLLASHNGKNFDTGYYKASASVTTSGITNTNSTTFTPSVTVNEYVKAAGGTVSVKVTTADGAVTGGASGLKGTVSIASNATAGAQTPATTAALFATGAAIGTNATVTVAVSAVTDDFTITITLGDLA